MRLSSRRPILSSVEQSRQRTERCHGLLGPTSCLDKDAQVQVEEKIKRRVATLEAWVNLITHASWKQPAPPAQTRHVISCICGDGRVGDGHQHDHGR